MSIKYRTLYVLSLLAVSHVGMAGVESTATQDLHSKIKAAAINEIASSGTPSLQISVGKGGQIIFEGAYGIADVENEVRASLASKYRTASVAKWFTATAAMQLSENGTLDLDASIQKYCPEFPIKETQITARQLLTHTAGIRGYIDYEQALSETKNAAKIERLQIQKLKEKASFYTRYTDVLKPLDTFKNDAVIYTPGTDWKYTSFGYRLLACVMQGAAKKVIVS